MDAQLIDQATITCRTPAHNEGTTDVMVQMDGFGVVAPERFTYFNPASRFGGAWGDPIEGSVNISVYGLDGAAVEGAFVMLTVDNNTPHQGWTNVSGQLTFSGDDVLGQQYVTATAAGYSSASIQSVNAENITVLLYPSTPPSGGGGGGTLPLATITGVIDGFQKIKEPEPYEEQMVIVETTRESPWRGNPSPGTGNVVTADGDGSYTLISRVGDIAVVAIGGLVDTRTGIFTPYVMGIERYMFVTQGETYELDMELDIDLDNVMRFKLTGVALDPSGPDINRIRPWVDLGFEGVFGGWDIAEGVEDTITAWHQPPLEGELEDATFFLYGGSWRGAGSSPYALAVKEVSNPIPELIEMPELVAVPRPEFPVNNGVVQDRYVSFAPSTSNQPDFWMVQLYMLPSTVVWEVTIPGDQNWFQRPEFPDFSMLPVDEQPRPYGFNGPLYMVVTGARIPGFDYDQHEYITELRRRDSWTSWSRNTWYILLPD